MLHAHTTIIVLTLFAFVYCYILNAQCLVFGLLQIPTITITLYLSAYSVLIGIS